MIPRLSLDSWSRLLMMSSVKAPTMIGMARKNENSAAARLSMPISMEPTMVDPDRDTPGTRDRHWHSPITTDFQTGSCIES